MTSFEGHFDEHGTPSLMPRLTRWPRTLFGVTINHTNRMIRNLREMGAQLKVAIQHLLTLCVCVCVYVVNCPPNHVVTM